MEKELDSIAILVKMETPLLSGSYQIKVIGFRKRFSKTKYQKKKAKTSLAPRRHLVLVWILCVVLSFAA